MENQDYPPDPDYPDSNSVEKPSSYRPPYYGGDQKYHHHHQRPGATHSVYDLNQKGNNVIDFKISFFSSISAIVKQL